ncbi:dipeptidase PepE [Thalassomonas sp. M1454]|uniref:dipeptidase PepE n=1 Tax=Thalassomonas sp. M1454 TaxID=2594477 RepID=UPI00117FA958|nr:dipeptidase PepE [Thalassomonas sp. M1454]TRX56863.1 dipeptidase PepE [Thalassomonas sp. M1454]
MNKNLLLLSSSRVGDTAYLDHAKAMISDHLNTIDEVIFIPFAGVTMSNDDYTDKVADALTDINVSVKGIHSFADPVAAINNAKAILVGGGNTFNLLNELYQNNLIPAIQEKVNSGTPYIGWSAGSNIAGMTIRTTNDMPIIQPPSFDALNLIPVQLNPHYTDYNPPGFNGETREQRLSEFMVLNPETYIVGIVEGTALKLSNNKLSLIGPDVGYLFSNQDKQIVNAETDLSYLL